MNSQQASRVQFKVNEITVLTQICVVVVARRIDKGVWQGWFTSPAHGYYPDIPHQMYRVCPQRYDNIVCTQRRQYDLFRVIRSWYLPGLKRRPAQNFQTGVRIRTHCTSWVFHIISPSLSLSSVCQSVCLPIYPLSLSFSLSFEKERCCQ